MSLDSQFQRLVEIAKGDSPPLVDVTSRVLSQIDQIDARHPAGREATGWSMAADSRSLVIGSGMALAAAAIAIIVTTPEVESMTDPLKSWLEQFSVVLQ